jgi:mannose-6-phosphate isomerase
VNYKDQLITFAPNRVWRSYLGGKTLDYLQNVVEAKDSHFPEEWIASTVQAVNTGRESYVEGISKALLLSEQYDFAELVKSDPDYFLGPKHAKKYNANPMVLVKYLDSSVRLHFQAHPTAEFAKKHLNSNSGKAEAYYILDVREGISDPYIYLGFQNPPSREALKSMIENQEIDNIESCFKKIPVKTNDCFYIPGGMPHAIGEGILMIEVMEPSDWAVRFEFEKSGYTLPEEARFMKRGLDFCLDVFDYTKYSPEYIKKNFQQKPKKVAQYNALSYKESLVDVNTTDRFRISKSTIQGSIQKSEDDFFIGIVTKGSCTVITESGTVELKQYDTFFAPYGLDEFTIVAEEGAEIVECYPPL